MIGKLIWELIGKLINLGMWVAATWCCISLAIRWNDRDWQVAVLLLLMAIATKAEEEQ